LVWDLDEPLKKVKLLGEHEEELRQKIIELEALCKKLREDTQRLEEEKATLEEMVESHDELVMEIAREIGLDRMGEDEDEEEEDANNGGDAALPPPRTPPVAVPKEIDEEGPIEAIPEQEAPMPQEVVLADAEPDMPWLRLYHALMRDYEEHPIRMEDDFDDLDGDPYEGRSDVDEWFPEDGSNDRDWVIKSKS
jgi:hypothetical protein